MKHTTIILLALEKSKECNITLHAVEARYFSDSEGHCKCTSYTM